MKHGINTANLVGMKVIYGYHKGCVIGLVPCISGVCIANDQRGIIAMGLPNSKFARKWIDEHIKC